MGSILADPDQKSRTPGSGFIMREWTRLQIVSDPLSAERRVDAVETPGKRMSRIGFAQSHDLVPAQKRLHCPAQTRPELDLTGDRSLRQFRSQTGVENEGIGKLNRLAHGGKVA